MPDMIDLTGYPLLSDEARLKRITQAAADLSTRRSVRDFADTPVPRAVIETAIRAAGSAPSGANHQPWHFTAVSDPDVKRKIRIAAEAEEAQFYGGKAPDDWIDALAPLGTNASKLFLETAPWLIAVFAQRRGGEIVGQDKKNYYVTESVGLATGFLLTALHAAGLGTLTHTPAPMGFLREICGRPASEKPFALIVAGHPAIGAQVPAHALIKKRLEDISSFI